MIKYNKVFTLITLLMLLCPSIPVAAQQYSKNMSCVRQFTGQVSSWLETRNIKYRISAEEICSGKVKIRVSNELVEYLAVRNNTTEVNGSYTLDSYFNFLAKEMSNSKVQVKYTMPDFVNPNKIENPNKDVDHYVCDVTLFIGGKVHKSVKDLFYVRDGKISKIGKYIVTENNKISVDYSDFLNEYETIGLTYNYGKYFQVGGSFNYSFEEVPFMLSLDFGVNLDSDKYIIDKVEMTDIMNYKRDKKVLDPKFFLTLTPQLYLKYFSIGCGVGFLYMDGTAYTDESWNSSSSEDSSSETTVSTDMMFKPMIRPVVKGFIPLTDELFISLSVGYDMIFGYKDKNGFNVGLGFQWEL